MIRTIEAFIDPDGKIHLDESVEITSRKRVLVTILDEAPSHIPNEEAFLSEQALAEDWNRPEEDEAWSYLQQAP